MHTGETADRGPRSPKGGLRPGNDPRPAAERALRMASQREKGLYDPRNEHDACGVGFVANIKGRKSHDIIRRGLQILVNLDHRGAVGADPLVGDGAGCHDPDAGRAAARLGRQARSRIAAARPLRGRDVLSADGRGGARRRGRAFRAFCPRRGADPVRLARGRRRYDRARGRPSSRRCRISRRRSSRPRPRSPTRTSSSARS